jgi:hypothetical protein
MYDSILANAGTKIIFRVERPEDMKPLAPWLFMAILQLKYPLCGCRDKPASDKIGAEFFEGVLSMPTQLFPWKHFKT